MATRLAFVSSRSAFDEAPTRVFVGRRERLLAADVRERVPAELAGLWERMVKDVERGDDGGTTSTWTEQGKVIIRVLSEACSRHNSETRSWSLMGLLRGLGRKDAGVLIAMDDASHAYAAAAALGRAHPTYSATSTAAERTIKALLLPPKGALPTTDQLLDVCEGVRKAAHWVDSPPNVFNTQEFVAAARACAAEIGASIEVIEGDALKEGGFGGIIGVGQGSENPPAMVVIRYRPSEASGPHVGMVGKGITYDTGGLSIKTKTGMPGMKTDMGGAAAVLGATWAAGRLGLKRNLTSVLCIAENSVSAASTRPDDVLDMYSGRKVEINNTDAEGRLVLADGLAWLTKHEDVDRVLDMATLTGAQMIATGKRHAALYVNSDALEDELVALGKATGELVHPLPFAPEFFRREFRSKVADLRNSVKDRANGQSSCAGQFLHEHIRSFKGEWAHIDLAGPSVNQGRGTGFGVLLGLGVLGLMDSPL